MNVVIVGPFWFPHGSASAARVRNYALGLRDCGARVHVISMAPPPRLDGVAPRAGLDYQGISYEYVAPTSAVAVGWRDAQRSIPRLRNRLADKVRWFGGLYAATPFARRRLRERIAARACDLVFVYDRSALRMTPLVRLCRDRGVTSVLDVVEVNDKLKRARTSLLYCDFEVGRRATARLFDGLTVISSGLEALYRARGCDRTLIVPSIEEWPAVPARPEAPTGNASFQLTYVGALLPRDAPELLLEAVRVAADRGAPVTLDVIGHFAGTDRGRRIASLRAVDPVLRRTVRLVGSLSDEALAERLRASDGLVLTRRKAPAEELSFPTRLVEYLRHGRPVFVSDVGDVSHYLRDGEAVLLHPTDPARVADAIAAVAASADRGAEIGRRGREAGARSFDRKRHAARLLDFAAGLQRQVHA
jgi:glycosyltransferase involved in cell wall biosynthesis